MATNDFIKVKFKKAHPEYAYSAGDIGMVRKSKIPDPLSNDFIEVITEEGASDVEDFQKYGESSESEIAGLRKLIKYLVIGLIIEAVIALALAALLIFK
jgi:hypothetical protein